MFQGKETHLFAVNNLFFCHQITLVDSSIVIK